MSDNPTERQPLTDEEIAEAEALCTKASRGPWIVEKGRHQGDNWLICSFGCDGADDIDRQVTTDHARADDMSYAGDDAAFVAMARSVLPRLLAERAEMAQDKARVDWLENRGTSAECRQTKPRDGGFAEEYWRVGDWEATELRDAIDDAMSSTPGADPHG